MPRGRGAPQSEVTRAIVLEDSPCCEVPHLPDVGREVVEGEQIVGQSDRHRLYLKDPRSAMSRRNNRDKSTDLQNTREIVGGVTAPCTSESTAAAPPAESTAATPMKQPTPILSSSDSSWPFRSSRKQKPARE